MRCLSSGHCFASVPGRAQERIAGWRGGGGEERRVERRDLSRVFTGGVSKAGVCVLDLRNRRCVGWKIGRTRSVRTL